MRRKKINRELEKCKPFLIDLINRLDLRDTWPKHLSLHICAFKKIEMIKMIKHTVFDHSGI